MAITTVATTTSRGQRGATFCTPQRKTFIAHGREWVFYSNGSGIYFKSRVISPLGSWSSATAVLTTDTYYDGEGVCIFFDGAKVHAAFGSLYLNRPCYYRQGTPASNGTISWGSFVNVYQESGWHPFYVYGCVDSAGYPVIAWSRSHDGKIPHSRLFVRIATNTAGTSWGTATELDNTSANHQLSLVPLPTGRRLLAIWSNDDSPYGTFSRLWDGSSWGARQSLEGYSFGGGFSAVALGSSVLCVGHQGGSIYSSLWTFDSWGQDRLIRAGSQVSLTSVDNTKAIAFVEDKSTSALTKFIGSPDGGDAYNASRYLFQMMAFVATSSGTISSIAVKSSIGVSGNVKVAVYANDPVASAPSALLAKRDTAYACYSGWNWVPLETPLELVAGTTYWLASISDTDGVVRLGALDGVYPPYASKTVAFSGFTFPDPAEWDAKGLGLQLFLQGWGIEVKEDSGLYVAKYHTTAGWVDEEKLSDPPDLNSVGSSWIADYLAVGGKVNVVWTQGASAPYNVRHLSYDFGEATWAITGYLWVEEDNLCYSDTDELKRFWLGTKAGATGQAPGYLWVEGVNLRYIGSSGDERYIAGVKEGATGQTTGQLWLESDNKLHYIDSSGDERTILGTLAV